jgi:hypothetical protein
MQKKINTTHPTKPLIYFVILFVQISDLNSQVNDLRGKLWVFYALCSTALLILANFVNVSVNNTISIHMSNTFGSEKEWTPKVGIEVDNSASVPKLRTHTPLPLTPIAKRELRNWDAHDYTRNDTKNANDSWWMWGGREAERTSLLGRRMGMNLCSFFPWPDFSL